MALSLGAGRVEIAHVQYYGWALKNRAALMPSREQVEAAVAKVEKLRAQHHGRIVIDAVVPDYYARFPKPCVGGWGRRSLNVTPAGTVLPCHAAEVIPGLEFWNVREHSLADIWRSSPAFNGVPRHRLDAGAVQELRAQGEGFRRLPLPGLPDRRRRARRRPGLPSVAASRAGRRTCRSAGGCGLQLPAVPDLVNSAIPRLHPSIERWTLGGDGVRSAGLALLGRSIGDKRLRIREDFDEYFSRLSVASCSLARSSACCWPLRSLPKPCRPTWPSRRPLAAPTATRLAARLAADRPPGRQRGRRQARAGRRAADRRPPPTSCRPRQLKLPAGFNIEVYASGIANARSLRVGDKGTVFVGTRFGDKVTPSSRRTARPRTRSSPRVSIARTVWPIHNGTLYIAELSQISKIDNVDANLDKLNEADGDLQGSAEGRGAWLEVHRHRSRQQALRSGRPARQQRAA